MFIVYKFCMRVENKWLGTGRALYLPTYILYVAVVACLNLKVLGSNSGRDEKFQTVFAKSNAKKIALELPK
jgi:hypothetical protein